MKNFTHLFLFSVLLIVTAPQFSHAQTLVNLARQYTTNQASLTYPFQTAIKISDSEMVVVGSVNSTTNSNFVFAAKYNTVSGAVEWEDSGSIAYDSSTNYIEAITGACVAGPYLYVSIAVNVQQFGNGLSLAASGIAVGKFSLDNGAEVWLNHYYLTYAIDSSVQLTDTSYIMPTSIVADGAQNVYVGGIQETGYTGSQLLVFKIDSNGDQLWSSTFDSVGMYSGAVALTLNTSGTALSVTGFSGNAWSSWDFITTGIATDSGEMAKMAWADNGNGSFSSPAGIADDYSGRTYIAGTAVDGSATHVKTIGFDSVFNARWVKIWGNADSLPDSASRMNMDVDANILITGFTTASNGARQLLVLKYNTAGTLIFSHTVAAPNPINNCVGNSITSDANLNVYVTGYFYNGTTNSFITIAYDPNGNLLWQKVYYDGNNDVANDIVADGSGNIWVSGISSYNTTATYLTLEYQQWTPPNCDESSNYTGGGNIRATCPTITYNFRNGQITSVGADSSIEFDIYARQNTPGIEFSLADIIFTYSNNIFGGKVVDSGNISVTRGTITTDTNYVISLADTLFKSDIVPPNGGEVWLSIAARDTSGLYVITDTFQQLCHVKMNMKTLGGFGIYFDKFFMQTKSLYYYGDNTTYNYIYTGGPLALAANESSVDLYLTVANCGSSPSSGNIDATIWGYASSNVNVQYVYAFLSWADTVINYTVDDVTQDPGAWVPVPNGSNTNYTSYSYVDQTNPDFYYLTVSANALYSTLYAFPVDPSSGAGDILDVVNFSYADSNNCFDADAQLYLVSDETATLNPPTYFIPGGNGATMNFNVNLINCHDSGPCCVGGPDPGGNNLTRGGSCGGTTGLHNENADATELKVYPNPFSNSFEINFLLIESGQVSLNIEDMLGQNLLQTSFGDLTPGSYNRDINIPVQFAPGIYILKFRMNGKENAVKIIKE